MEGRMQDKGDRILKNLGYGGDRREQGNGDRTQDTGYRGHGARGKAKGGG